MSLSNESELTIDGDHNDFQQPNNSKSDIIEPENSSEANENTSSYIFSKQSTCGKLGGAAIFQAFGKLSHKLMPNLVANWVTGQNGQHQKSKTHDKRARIDISGEFDKHGTEPRIIAGTKRT